jgi:hypothetical protein
VSRTPAKIPIYWIASLLSDMVRLKGGERENGKCKMKKRRPKSDLSQSTQRLGENFLSVVEKMTIDKSLPPLLKNPPKAGVFIKIALSASSVNSSSRRERAR